MVRVMKSVVILLIALMNLGAAATAFADATPLSGAIYTTDIGCLEVNGNVFYENKQAVYLSGGPAHKNDTQLPDGAYFVRVIEPGLGNNTPTVLGTSGSERPFIVAGGIVPCYQLWNIVKYLNGDQGYDDTSNNGGEYQVEVSTVDFTDPAWSASDEKSDNFKVRKNDPLVPGIAIELDCPSSVWVGQTITYKMRAHNTGEIPLTSVTISGTVDGQPYGPLPGADGVSLAVGEYSDWMEYTITATSAGHHENIATAQGIYDVNAVPPTVMATGSCSPEAYELTVTKTANTAKDRTYTWTVQKSVTPTALEIRKGAAASALYTVTTSSTSADSNFVLDGTITISNPAPFDAVLSSITDTIGGVTISGCAPNSVVPKATTDPETHVVTPGTLVCAYTGTFASAAPDATSNTASVTVDDGNGEVADPSFSGSVGFSFEDGSSTAHLFNNNVTDTDTLSCPAGFTCTPNGGGSWSYDQVGGTKEYSVEIRNDSVECSQYRTVDNTVQLSGGSNASASAHVLVYTADCRIDVSKYYDTNVNGSKDAGECPISGWNFTITLSDSTHGTTTFSVTTGSNGIALLNSTAPYGLGASVKVCESVTAPWTAISPGTCAPTTTLTGDLFGVFSFGNVKLGAGGGLTLGYWSNKNGQATMTLRGMTGELAMLSALNLRNANGTNFDPSAYAGFRTWLLSANATNMAYMLSAQLSAMELNVYNGNVNGTRFIYAPGTHSANLAGFATVNAVMAEANTELGLHGLTTSSGATRSYQEALKTALDKANQDASTSFVLAPTCSN